MAAIAAAEGVKKPVEKLVEADAAGDVGVVGDVGSSAVAGARFEFRKRAAALGKMGKGSWRGFRLESNWVVDITVLLWLLERSVILLSLNISPVMRTPSRINDTYQIKRKRKEQKKNKFPKFRRRQSSTHI